MPTLKTVQVEAKQLNGFKIKATARQHVHTLDQAPPLGTDAGSTPLEYLFTSLAGCFISTGYIIARQRGLDIQTIEVTIEGSLDTEVVGGKSTEGRPGFTAIQICPHVEGDLSPAEKEQFLAELTRRCPVLDTIQNATPIIFTNG